MLRRLKDGIRVPVIKYLNRRYERELDNQFLLYDDYIRKREQQIAEALVIPEERPEPYRIITDGKGVLSQYAGKIIAHAMSDPRIMLIYGDEDELSFDGRVRMNPWFKADYSPDSLESSMYMGGLIAVKEKALKEGKDLHETALLTCRNLTRENISHLDFVLYHKHRIDYGEGKRPDVINHAPKNKVSMVIPSKDNQEILFRLLESILKLTAYEDYDIVVVDNGSTETNRLLIENKIDELEKLNNKLIKYIYTPQEFNFSKMCNEGASKAEGDYILFLNDDCEIADSAWLSLMMHYAQKPHVGAVGIKLYYPGGTRIQHCGVYNIDIGPVHKLQYYEDSNHHYGNASGADRNVIAVTGACLLVDKEKFYEAGCFNEELRVAFNDVDLCFSLYERGYYNVVVNTCFMYHHESLSRGRDESADKLCRLMAERELLYKRHPNLEGRDPFYPAHMTTDISDVGYSFSWEYEISRDRLAERIVPTRLKRLCQEWDNAGISSAIERYYNTSAGFVISGYAYITGTDNTCFDFSIILQGENGNYIIPTRGIIRPDLLRHSLPMERAGLRGFCVYPDLSKMPAGSYRIGIMAKGIAYRMTLTSFTNRYININ